MSTALLLSIYQLLFTGNFSGPPYPAFSVQCLKSYFADDTLFQMSFVHMSESLSTWAILFQFYSSEILTLPFYILPTRPTSWLWPPGTCHDYLGGKDLVIFTHTILQYFLKLRSRTRLSCLRCWELYVIFFHLSQDFIDLLLLCIYFTSFYSPNSLSLPPTLF